MTGAALAAALVDRGLDQSEYAAKESLFDLVLSRFGTLPVLDAGDYVSAQGPNGHAWWVPGRLEVFGTHTDYAGGRTLVCAIPRGFAVVARHRSDGVVRVVDARREQELELNPRDDIQHANPAPQFGWRHYVAVVARRLARNFPDASLGSDIVIASDLPRAAGMSSSSALLVAIAAVLVHRRSAQRARRVAREYPWHRGRGWLLRLPGKRSVVRDACRRRRGRYTWRQRGSRGDTDRRSETSFRLFICADASACSRSFAWWLAFRADAERRDGAKGQRRPRSLQSPVGRDTSAAGSLESAGQSSC